VGSWRREERAADQSDVFPLRDRGGGHGCWCGEYV